MVALCHVSKLPHRATDLVAPSNLSNFGCSFGPKLQCQTRVNSKPLVVCEVALA